ncbi:MAG TPA: TonB-dependent receptor plug domain-containing protein [Burkholderiaceae bacterium]|nr:TonB-dependent receptor plug domain-containing protein [Burkholderiaceae bacterium]
MALSAPARLPSQPTTPSPAPGVPLLTLAALLAFTHAAAAQPAPVQQVEVTGRPQTAEDLTGFSTPLSRTPIDVTVVASEAFADLGGLTLSDLPLFDASITDSYDSVGYWSTFTIRGFPIDNQYNFRRDGLPINGETVLPLENKSGIEILKGLSGTQAGTSAPGGLVNLVVKRPDIDLRTATLKWIEPGTVSAQVDLSQRFGDARQFGARVNVSADRIDPYLRDAHGHRQTLSIATDWNIAPASKLEFEFEHSLQSEPTQPGFSMLGDVVPDPHSIDPRINLNDQPWSQPVVSQGNTMSVRYTQAVAEHWHLKLQAMQQQLVSNDHLAFPYGVYSDPDNCDPCDRYASDGHFSYWDYRSDDERRQMRVADAQLSGEFATGPFRHALTIEALESRFVARFNDLADNLTGMGTIDGRTIVAPNPTPDLPNADRTERNTELTLRDVVQIDAQWSAWAGVRHTDLHRASWQTPSGDPTEATDYHQSFTTPWLSVTRAFGPSDMAYLSWGEGVQSTVTPNLAIYAHPGAPEPATTSRQWEGGWKHAESGLAWSLVGYDVQQPQWSDVAVDPSQDPSESNLLLHLRNGVIDARGLEAEVQWHGGPWTVRASAMGQHVRYEQTTLDTGAGALPPNVPERALKMGASYAVGAAPGLALIANMSYEGPRAVLPDDSATIPGWTRFDLGARYLQTLASNTLVWRIGVDNVFDRRAWRESPYQYDHVYLFPLQPRTWRASVETTF